MGDLPGYPWWLLVPAAFGMVAFVTMVLNLFSGIGDRPGRAVLAAECGLGSDDFLRALAGTTNSPLVEGGTARLLDDGPEFFPAIFAALGRAERTIDFMVYIWEPGEVSDRLFDVLVERARTGVEVRVMIDGLGGHGAPEERIEELKRAGGKWAWFHPPRFGKLTRFHKRNHRRAIVVDGEIGYTGGGAVADKWLRAVEGEERWRDSMVEVRGRLAGSLQAAFAQLWAHATGEMLVGTAFYGGGTGKEPAAGEPITCHLSVISSPSSEDHPLRPLFWISIQVARERVYITNPYFVPDDTLRHVLIDRARAGVDVRVLVPNEKIDIALIRWASHSYYETLLEAGVRIFEYQPTMIHQKHLVVDGKWSVVGSANMDVRSKELNQENVLAILDRGFATQVEQTFRADLEHAEEIHLEAWRHRPLWHRLPERFSRLFEEQF